MSRLLIPTIFCFAFACRQMDFQYGGTSEGSAPAASPATTPTQVGPTEEQKVETSVVIELEQATVPSHINGSFLRCQATFDSQHQIVCRTFAGNGSAALDAALKAFIVKGQDKAWVETTFQAGSSPGEIRVKVPDGLVSDYGVVVRTASADYMDWVNQGLSAFSLVQDGSFESFAPTSTINVSDATSPHWKVSRSDTTLCSKELPIVEVQRDVVVAADGRNNVELDSSCAGTTVNDGQNVLIYQHLALIPGNSYLIRFQAMEREGALGAMALKVSLTNDVLMHSTMSNRSWNRWVFQRTASAEANHIAFEDTGYEDGRGVLLDAVEVIDFGQATPR